MSSDSNSFRRFAVVVFAMTAVSLLLSCGEENKAIEPMARNEHCPEEAVIEPISRVCFSIDRTKTSPDFRSLGVRWVYQFQGETHSVRLTNYEVRLVRSLENSAAPAPRLNPNLVSSATINSSDRIDQVFDLRSSVGQAEFYVAQYPEAGGWNIVFYKSIQDADLGQNPVAQIPIQVPRIE
jgi:hypothetical protein